jgi:hypothetical protein
VTLPAPSPSVQLFSRQASLTVGTVELDLIGQQLNLDFWFQVKRSLKPGEPNTCDVRMYNIADTTRKQIEQSAQPLPGPAQPGGIATKVVPVKIVAGYEGATETIFLGELRSAQTVTDGADTTTELTSGDGDQATLIARSTACFGPGANALVVAKQLLSDMGLGIGNIAAVQAVLQSAPLFTKGVALKGNSMDRLIALARSCALEVSVQGGVAQWTTLGQPLAGQAYSLSSDTGLIGTPSVDTKGVLTFEMLLAPGIRPGAAVVMDAKYVQGTYRITSVETTGDTAGNSWGHQCEAKRIGLAP